MRSTGLVLAAGAIAAANEVIFVPLSAPTGSKQQTDPLSNFNWRLIPATAVLAAVLAGIETVAPGFAVGLAGLTVLAVLVVQVGNAKTPLQNISSTFGKV